MKATTICFPLDGLMVSDFYNKTVTVIEESVEIMFFDGRLL